MAHVTVNYKGSTIAELSTAGTKTLNTSGKYCEGNITVNYTPPPPDTGEVGHKTYAITLEKSSGWVQLTALDANVLEHINDLSFCVTLSFIGGWEYVTYTTSFAFATNTKIAQQNGYPIYGEMNRQSSETGVQWLAIYYPANKTDTSTTLGGGQFRLDGDKYYFRPADGFVLAGQYRLTFTW